MPAMSDLARLLAAHRDRFRPVIPFDLGDGGFVVLDFSESNPDFVRVDVNDAVGFSELLFSRIRAAEIPVGIGRYDEDRFIYRHSPLFDGKRERRSIHLGIDLFVAEGTEVMTPLAARIHSVADNARPGDYGPTVILEHELDGTRFWTLYGHLGRWSVLHLEIGAELVAGESFAEVGNIAENGGWPPHLHFQVVSELGGRSGDYPGVAAPSERARWLALCPDPNLILGIPGL
jgi:hypothetical protein